MTVRPTALNLEAVNRPPDRSVLTYGDSDLAGNADRFSVSGTALWVQSKLGWYPITASSKKQSTVALSSGVELGAALSGAFVKQGFATTMELLVEVWCCDSSAALGMIKRKGSTRQTRHIELKAFFLQRWSARPEVRLVQVEKRKRRLLTV